MSSAVERILLHSTLVSSVVYRDDGTLDVEFCRGTTYRYLEVPKNVFEDLLRAESVGRYFNRHIRHCFKYLRLA